MWRSRKHSLGQGYILCTMIMKHLENIYVLYIYTLALIHIKISAYHLFTGEVLKCLIAEVATSGMFIDHEILFRDNPFKAKAESVPKGITILYLQRLG